MSSSYRKTMAEAIREVKEAQMVSDISGISITALRKEANKFNIKVARVTPGGPMGAEYEVTFSGAEKDLIAYAKEHLGFDDKPGNFMQLKKHLNMSYNDIEEISNKLKLKVLARKIKRLKDKFLKKTIPGTGAMFAQKEELELDEGSMKRIYTMDQEGKSAAEIAKVMKLPVKTIKDILGEDVKEENLQEFSDAMLDKLKREYEPLKGKTISVDQANKLRKIFNMVPDRALDALRRKKIPFLSGLALSRMIQKGMPVKEETELEESKAAAEIQRTNTRRDSMDYGMYKKAVELLRTKQYAKLGKHIYDAETAPREYVMGVIAKKEPDTFKKIYGNQSGYYSLMKPKLKEQLEEQTMRQKAVMIAKKMAGNMTDAVKEIEKLMKGLSKDPVVATTLKRVNEVTIKTVGGKKGFDYKGQFITDPKSDPTARFSVDPKKYYGLTDKQIKDLAEKIKPFMISYSKNGKHAGFEDADTLPELQRKAANLRGKGFTIDKMGRYNPPVKEENEKEMPMEPKKDNEKKESENKDKEIASLKDQISMLKTKLENEKNKAVKPEPNPDTGEVPLTVGVAYKHFKAKQKKEVNEARYLVDVDVQFSGNREENIELVIDSPSGRESDIEDKADDRITQLMKQRKFGPSGARIDNLEVLNYERTSKPVSHYKASDISEKDPSIKEADLTKKQIKMVHKVADDLPKKDFKDRYGKDKGDAVRFGTATNMVKKKLGMKEDKRIYVETIAGLKKKAEKSGMPYGILKKVYDRGMAAWKSGHRPGASQQQWAFARVNSFVTKSSGTWGGADKDLAAKVRGSK